MAGILVDTNVIIDAADPGGAWHAWSASRLEYAADTLGVCINPIIYAELAGYMVRNCPTIFSLLAQVASIDAPSPSRGGLGWGWGIGQRVVCSNAFAPSNQHDTDSVEESAGSHSPHPHPSPPLEGEGAVMRAWLGR